MNPARPYLEATTLVVVWMAAARLFRLDPNAYLVLGVPLVVCFQRLLRRQPIRKLWVRDAESFRLDGPGLAIAAALMLMPGYELFAVGLPTRQWSVILWMLCCLAGAVFAAFALRRQTAAALRRALPAFGVTLLIGGAIMASSALANGRSAGFAPARLVFLLQQFFLYFPVCFALRSSNPERTGTQWF